MPGRTRTRDFRRPFSSRRHPLGFRRRSDQELLAFHEENAQAMAWHPAVPWRAALRAQNLVPLSVWRTYQNPPLTWWQAIARARSGMIKAEYMLHPAKPGRVLWCVRVDPAIVQRDGLIVALQMIARVHETGDGQGERVA